MTRSQADFLLTVLTLMLLTMVGTASYAIYHFEWAKSEFRDFQAKTKARLEAMP